MESVRNFHIKFMLCSFIYVYPQCSTGELFFDTTSKTFSTQRILLFHCLEGVLFIYVEDALKLSGDVS